MKVLLCSILILLAGCQAMHEQPRSFSSITLPWRVGFTVPSCMDAWVEWAGAEDMQGRYLRLAGGVPAYGCSITSNEEQARGWKAIGVGGMGLSGYDLPKRLYVRWQSIVEQRTYKAWVDLPEEARALLRLSNTTLCPATPEDDEPVGMAINMGLAPGGMIVVWVRDPCSKPIQVARVQAEEEPLGPYQGESSGEYYFQEEASKRYIERFGIPYGSW